VLVGSNTALEIFQNLALKGASFLETVEDEDISILEEFHSLEQ
jgi:Holliday junction resolvasome RuvABC DNA-binding subunit